MRTVDSDPRVWSCLVSALSEMISSVNTLMCWWWNTQWEPRRVPLCFLDFIAELTQAHSNLLCVSAQIHRVWGKTLSWGKKLGAIWLILTNEVCAAIAQRRKDTKLILSPCLLLPARPPLTGLPELWSQGYSLENSLSSPWRLVGGTAPEGAVLALSPLVAATGRVQPQHCPTRLWGHSTAWHCSWARSHCLLIPTVKKRWVIHPQLGFPEVIFTN